MSEIALPFTVSRRILPIADIDSVQSFVVFNPHTVVCLVATTDLIHIVVLGLTLRQLCWIQSTNVQHLSQRNTAWICFQTPRQKEHKGVDTTKMFVDRDTREL